MGHPNHVTYAEVRLCIVDVQSINTFIGRGKPDEDEAPLLTLTRVSGYTRRDRDLAVNTEDVGGEWEFVCWPSTFPFVSEVNRNLIQGKISAWILLGQFSQPDSYSGTVKKVIYQYQPVQ